MRRDRIDELDAIRGLAALGVVLFHLTTRFDRIYGHLAAPSLALPLGHYGVQLFFGLSGFVILMTLERTRRPMDFVVSRASRLYPAYWAAIAITTLFVTLGPLPDLRRGVSTILLNLTMLEGFVGAPYVDGVYWTLAIELAFYACMFALWLLRGLPRIEWVMIGWIGLKWLWWWQPGLSYALGMLLVQDNVPFFTIGICAYRLYSGARSAMGVLPIFGLALLTTGVIDGSETLIVAILVSALFLGIATGRMRWLRWRPLLWLGAISYPLYLLHENIGFVLLSWLKQAGVATDRAILCALFVSLALASIVSRAIERPALAAIRAGWRRMRPVEASTRPC